LRIEPRHATANGLACRRGVDFKITAGHRKHGLHDLAVACTAAKNPANRVQHLILGRTRVALE
jgi:hypothetical protein